jgi:tripartite-type tricarboxylate transporter receptor subunit TctC
MTVNNRSCETAIRNEEQRSIAEMKNLSRIVFAAVAIVLAQGTLAQAYPVKPVRALVPFGAGGQSDVVARVVAQKLSERWNQPVLVENRVGANGNIGTEAATKAAPDGYTLFFPTQTLAVNARLAPIAGVDPLKDLAPISTTGFAELVLVVNADVPARSVAELVAFAKANPGKLHYGLTSVGTSGHLGIEQLNSLAGISIEAVPYTAIANLISDLVAGRINVYFPPPAAVIAHLQSSRLRALAATGTRPLPLMPDLPLIKQSFPTLEASTWFAVLAPARTPADILARLNADVRFVLDQADVKQRLSATGVVTAASSPEELRGVMERDIRLVDDLMRRGAIKGQ